MSVTTMSIPAATAPTADASPLSTVQAQGLASVAKALAADPAAYSRAARAVVSSAVERERPSRAHGAKGQTVGTYIDEVNINQKVVTADEDIYVAAPATARSAARELRRLSR